MNRIWIILVLSFIMIYGCKSENYYPKPMGFHRIDLPEQVQMNSYEGNCPYTFQYPSFAYVMEKEKCNQDIAFPKYKAILHCTNIQFNDSEMNNLFYHSEYSRKLAYEHRIKADAINETAYTNDSLGVYGVTYEIIGDVACNYQFFLTDSTDNFYRGSLYFNVRPNVDSLKPVLDYIKTNINAMISTFDWK
ncbi:gliding motility lipoprotein GldD [Flavobacteriales bacterium]|jgi:gliding motility-associated lipoprotein GldD|nr:gliding motility lipoprotein GldD [Flavobacteriales bacterium]